MDYPRTATFPHVKSRLSRDPDRPLTHFFLFASISSKSIVLAVQSAKAVLHTTPYPRPRIIIASRNSTEHVYVYAVHLQTRPSDFLQLAPEYPDDFTPNHRKDLVGVFWTLESANKCAEEEAKDVSDYYSWRETEKDEKRWWDNWKMTKD